uniref:Caspase 8 n=1 Tax=Loxodonta africana TaxID=9785 RepID=G3U5N1_LOXAF
FKKCLFTIGEQLDSEELASLKFLCLEHIPQKSQEHIKTGLMLFEKLQDKGMLEENNLSFLKELLFRIQRLDLLANYLKVSQEEMERELQVPGKTQIFAYRLMLFQISQDITKEDLDSFKFFLSRKIPRSRLKDNVTFLDILIEMERKDILGERKLDTLKNICDQINKNLVKIIEDYENLEEPHRSFPEANSVLTCAFFDLLIQKRRCFYECPGGGHSLAVKEAAVYRMDRKHRGHCVIVNNHNFTTQAARPGTHRDAESLKCVFQWLGFAVRVYDDVTKADLEKALQEYKSHPDHVDGDCFVCCILTHGNLGAVYSSDGALIPIQEITSHFTAQQCPGLAHKPKLFFIQACQGDEIQPSVSIEADALNPEKEPFSPREGSLQDSIPVEADFLLGLATVPGYVSFRHPEKGSWYIQSLCNHLKDLVPRHEDILSILTAVNNDVSRQADKDGTKKQMPQPAFTLRKKLIFPVP